MNHVQYKEREAADQRQFICNRLAGVSNENLFLALSMTVEKVDHCSAALWSIENELGMVPSHTQEQIVEEAAEAFEQEICYIEALRQRGYDERELIERTEPMAVYRESGNEMSPED